MDLPDHAVLSLLAAAGLAAVHILSQQLRILDGIPRSRLLSAAGGLAVAFVAIRFLPAVADGDQRLRTAIGDSALRFIDDPGWALLLLSLFLFYGLERLARRSQADNRPGWRRDDGTRDLLAAHGHLRGDERPDRLPPPAQPRTKRRDHGRLLRRHARQVRGERPRAAQLAQGPVRQRRPMAPGCRRHRRLDPARPAPLLRCRSGALQAILAGAVLLNVLKEELPSERESRYWAFLTAGLAYAAFLLAF